MDTDYKKERISGSLGRCMLPLLDTLGWKGGKRTFLNALPYDYRDFDIHDMMNTMANLDFKVNTSRGTLNRLDIRLLPCLFVDSNQNPHVLISREEKGLFCFEGASSSFQSLPLPGKSGDFYFFDHLDDTVKNPEREQSNWFSNFFTRFRKPIFMAFFISLLLTFTALASPFIVMGIYTQINTAETLDGFWIIGAGILGILLVDLSFRLFRHRILSFLGARMGYLVSTQVFKRILSFSPSATENASVGSQIVRMRDFNSVRAFIEGPGMVSVMELPFLVILFVGLIVMAGYLAFIPAVTGLLLLFFSALILPFVKKNNTEAATSGSRKQAYLIEFFSEFRDIRMSGLSNKWRKKYETISADAAMDTCKTANINAVINHVSQATVSMAGALTIAVGVFGVLNGQFSGSVLIAAMMLVWKILTPISSGFSVFSQTIRIKKSLGQLNRLMTMPLETVDDNMPSIRFNGRIKIKGISLRYKPEYYPALLGMDLDVDKGEFVVIKGHDGAGKTSLLKLIMGMYKAQTGVITLDGTNIQQLPPALLRRSISYLPQEETLFNISIEKNLKYYSPASTHKEILEILDRLGLTEEIDMLPQGLDTPVSQLDTVKNHTSFRKRLSVARSLLNPSRIILLDEPSRGMETDRLQLLIDILRSVKSKKTVVVATNHPGFIPLADKVVTMNMGSITNLEFPGKNQ